MPIQGQIVKKANTTKTLSQVPMVLNAFSAPELAAAPDTQIGHNQGQDSNMVCGSLLNNGAGYAFSRLSMYPGQATGSYNLNNFYRVVKYQTSASGVTASLIGGALGTGNPFALPRKYLDATIVGADPFNGTDPALINNSYVFGGYGPAGFSNEYFRFNETQGFRLPSSPYAVVGAAPSTIANDLIVPSGGRAGMAGVPIGNNQIMLVGGYNASGVKSDVYIYNRLSNQWTAKASMPVALKGMRLLASGGNGIVSYVYAVGGSPSAGGQSDNRKIYRYDLVQDKWIVIQDANGVDLSIPGSRTVEIASVQGKMAILTQSEDEVAMIGYTFNHPTTVDYSTHTGKGSVLTSVRFEVPDRARGSFALLRCSPDAWVIGGSYGHGPTFNDRSKLVDKFTM